MLFKHLWRISVKRSHVLHGKRPGMVVNSPYNEIFIRVWVWSKPLVWRLFDPCSCHVLSLISFFSIKSHYERYNQLCLKAIIQFNLPWRCWDILRLEMAELFYNKVTRRVIREQKKIIRHLKNMHAVVHMCPFLWGVCVGVHANQA